MVKNSLKHPQNSNIKMFWAVSRVFRHIFKNGKKSYVGTNENCQNSQKMLYSTYTYCRIRKLMCDDADCKSANDNNTQF
jgi:hypothetical protein